MQIICKWSKLQFEVVEVIEAHLLNNDTCGAYVPVGECKTSPISSWLKRTSNINFVLIDTEYSILRVTIEIDVILYVHVVDNDQISTTRKAINSFYC